MKTIICVHLSRIFKGLPGNGLFTKSAKFNLLLCLELGYLAISSVRRVQKMDPQKVEVQKNWPSPRDVTNVGSWLLPRTSESPFRISVPLLLLWQIVHQHKGREMGKGARGTDFHALVLVDNFTNWYRSQSCHCRTIHLRWQLMLATLDWEQY